MSRLIRIRMHKLKTLLILFSIILIIQGCEENYVPKPPGYFRIDLPEKKFVQRNLENCPFKFESPVYSQVQIIKDKAENPCWFNINFPDQNAMIHFTYKPVENDLRDLIEETHQLTFEHQVVANRIESHQIVNDSVNVYGLIYDLGGNVASPLQFYLTDSSKHFLRASLYFMARPNPDSIQPVLDFIHKDVEHLIETWRWE